MGCSTALVMLLTTLHDCTWVARFGRNVNASFTQLDELQTSSIFSNVVQPLRQSCCWLSSTIDSMTSWFHNTIWPVTCTCAVIYRSCLCLYVTCTGTLASYNHMYGKVLTCGTGVGHAQSVPQWLQCLYKTQGRPKRVSCNSWAHAQVVILTALCKH